MPLADKIIELRKKQGWSQIDLADRLDVSRQSVSKWEMAQAVPELDKIIKMSELFAVTTDYLLKDDAPAPEQTDAPPPPPPEEPEAPPAAARPSRKRWPWILAVCAVLIIAVTVLLALLAMNFAVTDRRAAITSTTVSQGALTPFPVSTPGGAGDGTVTEEAAREQTAVSGEDAPDTGLMEYVYEQSAVTGGSISPEGLKAVAAEYAPYGITCDADNNQWYLDGEPIRVFTDILTSNGESLTGGNFQGAMRNYAGEGDIDVRTVRDFDQCDDEGHGTLLYVESCDIRHEDAHWVAHHSEDHHAEDHHE